MNRRNLWFAAGAFIFIAGCSHNPNKAEKIDTKIEKSQDVVDEKVGINKEGNFVVQKKVELAEELRRLQYDVYGLEDRVYGNRKYGSLGLYGALKECRAKVNSKELGGDGKLSWTEPLERVTDKEEEFKFGVDEKDKLVAISEEYLNDRLKRFQGYKSTLQKREDEYQDKLEICEAALKSKEYDKKKSASGSSESKSDN